MWSVFKGLVNNLITVQSRFKMGLVIQYGQSPEISEVNDKPSLSSFYSQ